MFFFPPFLKNYTNEYLKTYEWRRQAGEGKEMEARDKRGGSTRRCVASRADVPRVFFFVVCYYEADYAYSHYQYHEDSDTNWGLRRDVSRAPSTCKFYLFQYTYVLLTSIYR